MRFRPEDARVVTKSKLAGVPRTGNLAAFYNKVVSSLPMNFTALSARSNLIERICCDSRRGETMPDDLRKQTTQAKESR
jgi:hypothetical protein